MALSPEKQRKNLARLEGDTSNRVFEILFDWNAELEALSGSEDEFAEDDDDPDDLTPCSKRPSVKMGGPS